MISGIECVEFDGCCVTHSLCLTTVSDDPNDKSLCLGWPCPRSGEPMDARCLTCDGQIEYYDPTGDGLASFWSHSVHPSDEHDARPPWRARAVIEERYK